MIEVQCRAPIEFAAEDAGVHLQRRPRHLDVDRRRRIAVAETDRQSHHSLAADGADLRAGAVGRRDHQRGDAVDREIHMFDRTRRLIEALSVFKNDLRQMRPQPLVVVIRQQREQPVGSSIAFGAWLVSLLRRLIADFARGDIGQDWRIAVESRARRRHARLSRSWESPSDSRVAGHLRALGRRRRNWYRPYVR